jgi:hypothetical protein
LFDNLLISQIKYIHPSNAHVWDWALALSLGLGFDYVHM